MRTLIKGEILDRGILRDHRSSAPCKTINGCKTVSWEKKANEDGSQDSASTGNVLAGIGAIFMSAAIAFSPMSAVADPMPPQPTTEVKLASTDPKFCLLPFNSQFPELSLRR